MDHACHSTTGPALRCTGDGMTPQDSGVEWPGSRRECQGTIDASDAIRRACMRRLLGRGWAVRGPSGPSSGRQTATNVDHRRPTATGKRPGQRSTEAPDQVGDGRIWVSTARNGIYRLQNDTAINYSTAQGLDDYFINGLVADSTGNVIIMHNDGIECLNTLTMQFSFYGRLMGISDLQTGLNAFDITSGGAAWIGLREGLLSFTPPDARLNIAPLLNLLSVVAVEESGNNHQSQNLFPYDQNFLRARFVRYLEHRSHSPCLSI